VTIPPLTLNNGVSIPQLGFGTFQVPPESTREAVLTAFEVGYRHIDTAQMYRNERGVGQAVADSGLARDDVFITTKLNNNGHRRDDALRLTDASLAALGVEQLDLYLVHWPLPTIDVDYVETWKAMVEVLEAGKTRAIGVSNFTQHHLERIIDATGVVPAVNQIEAHPYLANDDLRAFGTERGIVTEAWSPLAQGKVLGDTPLEAIAARAGRTVAQVTLRWHLQRGDVVFPKSSTRERMAENLALFDFTLSAEDMAAIDGLDRGERIGPDPEVFASIPRD